MGVPKSVKLSDSEKPDREKKFNEALATGGVGPAQAFRAFADAYIAFVEAHGHVPSIPFEIVTAKRKGK